MSTSAPFDDTPLNKVVNNWQESLSQKMSNLGGASKEQQAKFKQSQDRLTKVWDAEEKPSEPDYTKEAKDALDELSKAFTEGATQLAKGLQNDDPAAISEGVINTVGSIFSSIGSLSMAGGPEMAVVGAVLSFIGSILDFFTSLFGGPPARGTTSITAIIARVVSYELQENRVDVLNDEYHGIQDAISTIHAQIDAQMSNKPGDLDQAVQYLDATDLKQVSLQLEEFIGKVEAEIEARFEKTTSNDLQPLFNMYWQSNIHLSLMEQRAVTFITSAVTNTSAATQMPAIYQVRLVKLMQVQKRAAEFFKTYSPKLNDLSKTLLIGPDDNSPGQMQLQLDTSDCCDNCCPDDLYIGRTALDSGYPYASMRPYASNASPLQVRFKDDSTGKAKSSVSKDDWVSWINNETDAEEQDRIVFYMGGGWYGKYMGKTEAGYNGGENDKADKVLFKFERQNGQNSPIMDGDTVVVRNKNDPDVILCGGDDGNDYPFLNDDHHGVYYLRQASDDNCKLPHWIVHIVGNDKLKTLVTIWRGIEKMMNNTKAI